MVVFNGQQLLLGVKVGFLFAHSLAWHSRERDYNWRGGNIGTRQARSLRRKDLSSLIIFWVRVTVSRNSRCFMLLTESKLSTKISRPIIHDFLFKKWYVSGVKCILDQRRLWIWSRHILAWFFSLFVLFFLISVCPRVDIKKLAWCKCVYFLPYTVSYCLATNEASSSWWF